MKTTRVMKVNPKRIQELKAKIERDPLNVNLYMMLASQLEADGKRRQALSVLEKAVGKARRNLGVTYCSYAAMLMSAGQPQLALQNFDTAVPRSVQDLEFSVNLTPGRHSLSLQSLNFEENAAEKPGVRSSP